VIIAKLRGVQHDITAALLQLAAKLEVDVDLALEFLAHLNIPITSVKALMNSAAACGTMALP
jgi:hypothetical protein